jgi:hypothetical protein
VDGTLTFSNKAPFKVSEPQTISWKLLEWQVFLMK